jgi:hypothetical protein
MNAWTFVGGNLAYVVAEKEGFRVWTVIVDQNRAKCSFAASIKPDPQTGRVVFPILEGQFYELNSYMISSAVCTIRQGNIFAEGH